MIWGAELRLFLCLFCLRVMVSGVYFRILVFVADNATYESLCPSVGRSVGHTVSMRTAFAAPVQLITAPVQLITVPAQLITAPAQLITAPAQPPVTGAAVYTALFV